MFLSSSAISFLPSPRNRARHSVRASLSRRFLEPPPRSALFELENLNSDTVADVKLDRCNSFQQNLMLAVKGFRLLRGQGRADPLAGTNATPPGFARKWHIDRKIVVRFQSEPGQRPGRNDFHISTAARLP